MFKLIFKGLSHYEDYDIEEETGIFLCPDKNYNDTESLSYVCYEECHKKGFCNKEYVKVDLSIFVPYWAGDEDCGSIYINFNKKPVKEQYKNAIYYINNRKQLIKLMCNLKQRAESIKNAYAEYAEKIIELRKYGEDFFLQVQKDYPVFADIEVDLPIVFADFYKDEYSRFKYDIGGNFCVKDIQVIIHIYDCWRELEELKITIRHEIIHYLLFRIGINNSDTAGIFHYFCNKYDAHAYKKMPDKEQKIYNGLMEFSPKEISEMLEKVKKKIIIGYEKQEGKNEQQIYNYKLNNG